MGISERDNRQTVCVNWGLRAFGAEHCHSVEQRAVRFLEEAIELYQAAGGKLDMAHRLLGFVFERPVGTIENELGGVGVTTLMLAAAAGRSADECERLEVERVLSKDPEEFARRNAEKNAAGFDTKAYPVKPFVERRVVGGTTPHMMHGSDRRKSR